MPFKGWVGYLFIFLGDFLGLDCFNCLAVIGTVTSRRIVRVWNDMGVCCGLMDRALDL